MPTIEELRQAMRAAQPAGRGAYIEEGRHVLEVDKAMIKRTLIDGHWKESWIVEFKVLRSSNPTHEVGSTRSYVDNPENSGAMGRFKACLMAICGIASNARLTPDLEQRIGDVFVALVDEERVRMGYPENFLRGRQVTCEGTAGKSKAGGPITNKRWEPYVAPAPVAA